MRNRPSIQAVVVAAALALPFTASCVGVGVDSYSEFRQAVESGATCEQLIDISHNFDDRPAVSERVAEDLEEIGCLDATSKRNDL